MSFAGLLEPRADITAAWQLWTDEVILDEMFPPILAILLKNDKKTFFTDGVLVALDD